MPPLPLPRRISSARPAQLADYRIGREVGHRISEGAGQDNPLGRLANRLMEDPNYWRRATADQLEDILALPGLSPRARRELE